MNESQQKIRGLALIRYYSATDLVFRALSERNRDAVSRDELRVGWELNQRAAERLKCFEPPMTAEGRDEPNVDKLDLSRVEDAVRFLATIRLGTDFYLGTFDYTEKLLARSFESRQAEEITPQSFLWQVSPDASKHDFGMRLMIDGCNEPLSLSDALAITKDWEATNQRRNELIEREVRGELTDGEPEELQHVQKLAWAKRNITMPLPILELAMIRAALKHQHGEEI